MIQKIATLYPTAQGGFVNLADVCSSFVERVDYSHLRNQTGWGYHLGDGSYVPWPWEECAEFQESENCGRYGGYVWVVFIHVRGAREFEAYSVHKTEAEANAALAAMRAEAMRCTVEVRS